MPRAAQDVFSFDHPPLHDPCTVAYIISPQLFEVCGCDDRAAGG